LAAASVGAQAASAPSVAARPAGYAVDPATAGALWAKAVAAVAAGKAYLAGRMTTFTEELDGQGRVVASERSSLILAYPNGPDAPSVEIESYYKNGKDITQERRAQAAKGGGMGGPPGGGGQGGGDWSATPLDAVRQADVVLLTARQETPAIVAVDYEQRAGKLAFVGTVRLNAATGAPFDATYGFKKPPAFVENFRTRLVYAEPTASGAVWPAAIEFEATAVILVVKKRFRGELRFLDYRPQT
jgi:hypothetical protein